VTTSNGSPPVYGRTSCPHRAAKSRTPSQRYECQIPAIRRDTLSCLAVPNRELPLEVIYRSEVKRRSKLVAAVRRIAFVALSALFSIWALDSRHKVFPLIFGVLACAALFYEQGYKLDANRKSLVSFIGFYLFPMLVVFCLVCRRVFAF
jgi:hypothetical protein